MSTHKPRDTARPRSPFVTLLLWVMTITVLAGLVQAAAWLLGLDFDILAQGHGGRAVLLAIAMGSLLVLMATERRSLAYYGLAISERWLKQLRNGFLVGLVFASSYFLLSAITGALRPQTDVGISRWLSACLSGLTAFGLAVYQETIFRGYLLSVLRERLGTVAGVVLVALLFALLQQLTNPLGMLTAENRGLFLGVFLAGALLAVMRLYHGNIVLPASLFAGWMFVSIVVRKTGLFAFESNSGWAGWFCPNNDPRQGPILWTVLAAGIATYAVLLRRKPAEVPSEQAALATNFKKVFPLSSTSLLAPLDLWVRQLWRVRLAIGWRYIPRLIATLVFSTINTLLSLPERLLLPVLLRRRKIPDPVFILGVHRSGTTHLHNLLALDERFITPRAYQVMNPIGFLFSGWLLTPLLGAFSPWKRPMDNVRFHIFSPQEEEYALVNVSPISPYWGVTFPQFGPEFDRYTFPERLSAQELGSWKKHYLLFLKKVNFWSSKHILLKNPFNTARVGVLKEMFPKAKFIHISRHPYAVYRSNVHLAQEGHCVMQLQDVKEEASYPARFLDNYRAMLESYCSRADQLPRDQVAEVRFEDLERNAVGEIERLYQQLGLELTPRFRDRLVRYLASVADYQKNRFASMPEEVKQKIYNKMKPWFERWGYETHLQNKAA